MSSRLHPFLAKSKRRWDDLYDGQRRLLRVLLGLALAGLVAPFVYLAARPAIDDWRHRQALEQADHFRQREDYRNAVLALHRATLIKPGDLETWRRAAELLDQLGLNDALIAHENVVALAPDDASAQVALAAAALRLEAPDVARRALQELAAAPAQRESFLRLSAELARTSGDLPAYAAQLAELRLLRPDDLGVRYNLALVRLHGDDAARPRDGREEMLRLLAEPTVRVRAALDLLRDTAGRRDAALAGATVRLLAARLNPGPVPADPWPALRAGLQRAALEGGAADVARVGRWLASVRLADEAAAWLDALPPALADTPPVTDLAAELDARAGRLDRLAARLAAGAWGRLPERPLALAVDSRRQFAQEQGARARALWQQAVEAAEGSPPALRALSRLAFLWGSPDDAELALRTARRARPGSAWAYRELRDLYFNRGDTARLLDVYAAWAQAQPRSTAVLRGWARTAAALGQVSDLLAARTAEAVAAEPDFHALIARADVLWQRQQPAEALALLARLSPAHAAQPDVLFLQAMLCRDLARSADATRLAARIDPARLLKEEAQLLGSGLADAPNGTSPAF